MPFVYQKYGKAQVRLLADNESCAMVMAQTFLDLYTHVSQVGRELKETAWHRMKTDGQPHPLSFLPGEGSQPWYKVTLTRSSQEGSGS